MASWVTSFYALCLFICGLLLSVNTNLWHYPSCVQFDLDNGPCLDVFFRYFDGYASAVGQGELVHHEWVLYLDHIYDYDDKSDTNCEIKRRSRNSEDFVNATWTQDGFSTCSQTGVDRFNSWWAFVCSGHCVEDDNCRRYPFFLGQHLWNNCSWDEEQDQPSYDLALP